MRLLLLATMSLAVSTSAHADCDEAVAVVINELMPDPTVAADDQAEWVELYNASGSAVDVSDWIVEAGTRPSTLSAAFTVPAATPAIAPGGYLVLAGTLSGIPAGPGVILVDPASTMGNAGSSADGVRLLDCDGDVVDVVVYGNSNEPEHIFLDEEGEQIIDGKLAPKPSGGRSLARAPDGADTNNSAFDFIKADATPGAANPEGGDGPGPCLGGGEVGDVLINEVFANPGSATVADGGSADGGYEWVELYNPGATSVAISGWRVRQAGTPGDWETESRIKFTFPADAELGPGEHVVVVEDLVEVPEGIDAYVMEEGARLSLGNSQDAVRFEDCQGKPIDTVVYGSTNDDGFLDADGLELDDDDVAPTVGSDLSLARRADGLDSGSNGEDFVLAEPTMGVENLDLRCKATQGSIFINELLANPTGTDSTAQTEWIELYNTSNAPVDISTWTLEKASAPDEDGPRRVLVAQLDPGAVIPAKGHLVVAALFADVDAYQFIDGMDFYSGTGGDQALLYDCAGVRADSVIYGGPNEDLLAEDDGFVPDNSPLKPSDEQCVARREDGVDTNRSLDDFATTSFCTPGEENEVASTTDDPIDPPDPTGCSRSGTPRTAGPRTVDPRGTSCASSPLSGPMGIFGLVLVVGGLRRRRG